MEYLSLIAVSLILFVPIFLPLVYWYVLKNRTSTVYAICRNTRRFWAVIIFLMLAFKLYQLPQREHYNAYEVMGEFLGQFMMAVLMWKKWKSDELDSSDTTQK